MRKFNPYQIANLVPNEVETFIAKNPDGSGNDFSIKVRRLPQPVVAYNIDYAGEISTKIEEGKIVLAPVGKFTPKVSRRFVQMLCQVQSGQVFADPKEEYELFELFAIWYHEWTHPALYEAAAFVLNVSPDTGRQKPEVPETPFVDTGASSSTPDTTPESNTPQSPSTVSTFSTLPPAD